MVVERRLSILISAAAAFILLTALWNVFVRPGHRVRAGPVPDAPTIVESVHTGDSAARAAAAAPPPVPTPAAAAPSSPPLALQPPSDEGGPSYMVLLARSEIRRRVRASAGLTYLNDIVAASADSGLHRWDNRRAQPVRVYLPTAAVANFQPAFLDAVRSAFQVWEQAGGPVRFAPAADSASAHGEMFWRVQFEGDGPAPVPARARFAARGRLSPRRSGYIDEGKARQVHDAPRYHVVSHARYARRRGSHALPGARRPGARGRAGRAAAGRGRRGSLLRLRAPLSRQTGPPRHLQDRK